MCIDKRNANRAIQRERHPSPTIDDILFAVNGVAMFSKIDIHAAYHQIELKEDSHHNTTFVTHGGLYQFKQLTFGISSASEKLKQFITLLWSKLYQRQ